MEKNVIPRHKLVAGRAVNPLGGTYDRRDP